MDATYSSRTWQSYQSDSTPSISLQPVCDVKMADESNEALRLLSLLDNYYPSSRASNKKDSEEMIEVMCKAPIEAFRCMVDMDG